MRHIAILLLSVVFTTAHANDFKILPGADDDLAKLGFAKWSTSVGFKPHKLNEDGTFFLKEGMNWHVELITSESFPDRVVLTAVFSGHPSNRASPSAHALINLLHSSYNIGSFNFDEDGNFVCQYNLTFDESLSPVMYRKFIDSAQYITKAIFEKHKVQLDKFTK